MSADLLRRAAKALREYAEHATPGPWHLHEYRRKDHDLELVVEVEAPAEFGKVIVAETAAAPDQEVEAQRDMAFIALMHPPVALALADWLTEEAERIHRIEIAIDPQVVDIARAVLREQP